MAVVCSVLKYYFNLYESTHVFESIPDTLHEPVVL